MNLKILLLCIIPFLAYNQNLNTFLQKAINQQENGQLDQAIQTLESTLPILEKRDSAYRWFGLVHCNMGYVYWAKEDPERAIYAFNKGIEYYEKDSLQHLEVYLFAHFDLGLNYLNTYLKNKEQSSLRDSADYYLMSALELKDSILPPNHPKHLFMLQRTAKIYFDRQDYESAKKVYLKAYDVLNQYHPTRYDLAYDISVDLAKCYNNQEHLDSALYYIQHNLEHSKKLYPPNHESLAMAYRDVSSMHHKLRDFDECFRYLDTAMAVNPSAFPAFTYREFLIKTAGYYFENYQYETSEIYYLKVINRESSGTIEENEIEGLALLQLFVVYSKQARHTEAFKIADRACLFFKEHFKHEKLLYEETCKYAMMFDKILSNPIEVSINVMPIFEHLDTLNFEEFLNETARALEFDSTQFRIDPNSNNDPNYDLIRANNLSVDAMLFLLKGNFEDAVKKVQLGYEQIVPSFKATNDWFIDPAIDDFSYDFSILGLLFNLKCGAILMMLNQNELSTQADWKYGIDLFEKTDEILQRMRRYGLKSPNLPFNDNLQLEFYFNKASLFGMRYQQTGNEEYLEELCVNLEKRKAANLLESLKLKSVRLSNPKLIALKNKEESLLNNLNKISGLIMKAHAKTVSERKQAERADLEERFFVADQKYAEFYADVKVNSPNYYQLKNIPTPTSFSKLKSLLDPSTAIINYYLVRDQLTIIVIQKNSPVYIEFGTKVPELVNAVNTVKKVFDSRGALNANFKQAALALYKTLIPELPTTIKNIIIAPDGILHDLPFDVLLTDSRVIDDKSIPELPFLIKKYNISYGPSATLIGENLENKLSNYDKLLLAYEPEENSYLDSLKLSQTLPSDIMEKQVNLFKGGQASKVNYLKTAGQNTRIIQLNAHGATDKVVENFRIQFRGSTFLYLPELMNQKLQTDLFILSSCELGSGKIMAAEGLLGFIRALQFAGAKNIITSKNRVSNRASTAFLNAFYHAIFERKENYTTALRSAKLKMLNSKTLADPFYWSGITLFGH